MAQSVPSVCSPSTGKYWICTLCFLLYGELSFLTFRFPGSTGKKIQILKKENQSQEMHYFIILKGPVFPLPPSLEECPRLLSPIICCRLAAAMKPSCRRLRFFTSLEDEETGRVMREGKGGNYSYYFTFAFTLTRRDIVKKTPPCFCRTLCPFKGFGWFD